MIAVLLGTNPYSFERLVRSIDTLAADNKWDVFIQLGNTSYEPSYCRYERFMEKDALVEIIRKSEFIICHGGFGSIRDGLAAEKVVVAVPRKPELNESPDYQEELVQELESEGRILAVYEIENLFSVIEQARRFESSAKQINKIPQIIQEFIERTQ